MNKQEQLDSVYMGTALLHARLSKAKRKQVGAVLVTPSGVTLTGYNGTPSGYDNACEINGVTKPEVIHAELNCILKAAKEGVSVLGSTVYVTLSPCIACAAMLAQAGIKELVYREFYRSSEGLDLLERCAIVTRNFVKGE
jgi:dCMP deaminase